MPDITKKQQTLKTEKSEAPKKKHLKLKRPRKSAGQSERQQVKRAASGARVLQVPERIWYKPLTWRYLQPVPSYKPLPKAWTLFRSSFQQLWENKKLFGGIVLIYGILNVILVKGISGSSNLQSIKNTLDGVFHGVGGRLLSSGISFGYLLVSSGSGNTATSGVYQGILVIACSLAVIWSLRKVIANQKPQIRDGFYFGMYPLVPFMFIILLAGLQLIPLILGGGLYSLVSSGGIATTFWQKAIFLLIFIALACWSLRMITATIISLYIVTLPDMTPLRAYRSAKELVYGRRLLLWRKLIFLPVVLLLLAAIIELPLILFVTPLAVWAFFVISMVTLPVVHSYLYNLYREML